MSETEKGKPIGVLSQVKQSQLLSSNSIPPMYITVEKYELDAELDAIIYHLEVGIQRDTTVTTKKVMKRYSELRSFDTEIRKDFGDSKYMVAFPPKAFLRNKDPIFLEERKTQLQKWLAGLVRIPGISTSSTVTRFFSIAPPDSFEF